MLNYKDYLEVMLDKYNILNEETFNEVTKNFKELDVDWEYYESVYDDINEYLLQELLGDDCVVTILDENTIQLDADFETLEELEEARDIVSKVGYNIENYNELLADLDENSPEFNHALKSFNELSESEKESFKKLINS